MTPGPRREQGAPGRATVNITPAWVARHTPKGAGSMGREAALVDIAQDLILRELHTIGLLDELVFKGGTSLRKLYAGNAGRFSLDLDFSVRDIGVDTETVLDLLTEHVKGREIGPFAYDVIDRRGKRHLVVASPGLAGPGAGILSSKLDVSPPPWLTPTLRGWIPMDIHGQYGEPPLPELPVVRMEENLAEKISRLNRATPARDMYDLRWVGRTLLRRSLDPALVRRLAVLKIWVDAYGVSAADGTAWKPGHESAPFDPERWLRPRTAREYDEEDIGALSVPPPRLEELSRDVSDTYAFLADLDDDERVVAAVRGHDRPRVLRMLEELPEHRLRGIGLH